MDIWFTKKYENIPRMTKLYQKDTGASSWASPGQIWDNLSFKNKQ
jgi:hypothetical protein